MTLIVTAPKSELNTKIWNECMVDNRAYYKNMHETPKNKHEYEKSQCNIYIGLWYEWN
jgi:hypothetical protein